MGFLVHESCYMGEEIKIGEGTRIWHFSHVVSGCTIGKDCNIGQNAVISPGVTFGNNCEAQNNVSVYTGVVCESGVFLRSPCVFTDVINPRAFIRKGDEYRETTIEEGTSIGANAATVCGNTIGEYTIIGAGAVVTKDVGGYRVAVGNPARHYGFACLCGENLKRVSLADYICKKCDKEYLLNGYKLSEVSNE